MKYCVLALFLVFFCGSIFCQGSIGLSVGVDFAQFQSHEEMTTFNFRFKETGFVNSSIVYGIKGEHYLTKKMALYIFASFTNKKNVERIDHSFFPGDLEKSYEVKILTTGLMVNYNLFKNIMIGAGVHYNSFMDATVIKRNGSMNFSDKEESVFGLMIGINYKVKGVFIEANYLNGSDFKIDLTNPFYNLTERVKSFNFKIGYMFQLYDGKK